MESHSAVLDGFIDLAREKIAELERAEVFIRRYYVISDLEGTEAEQKYQYFADMEDAIQAYHQLPNHMNKYLGKTSTGMIYAESICRLVKMVLMKQNILALILQVKNG